MAVERNVTADDHVFLGEDKDLEFVIYSSHAETAVVDVSTWDLLFVLRRRDSDDDPAIIQKDMTSPAGITITGVYNSNPALNTQKIVVAIYDTDTYDPTVSPPVETAKGKYRYSLKRMDDGSETILAFGNFVFLQATAR